MRTFSLSVYATEIGEILDQEVDVSRYYAELVPLQITPNEFWARYFFKLMLLMRGGIAPLDDDDDEEDLAWENDDDVDSISNQESQQLDMSNPKQTIAILQEENYKLKGTIKSLVARISELEALLTAQSPVVKPSAEDEDDDKTLDAISVDAPSSPNVNTESTTNIANPAAAAKITSSSSATAAVSTMVANSQNIIDEIVINKEDKDILVTELEMTEEEAEEALRECKGDLRKVLKKFAGDKSTPSSPIPPLSPVIASQKVNEDVNHTNSIHSNNSSDIILVEKDDEKGENEGIKIVHPPVTKKVPDISLSDDEEESWD